MSWRLRGIHAAPDRSRTTFYYSSHPRLLQTPLVAVSDLLASAFCSRSSGNLDGDDAIQSRVASLVDFSHAASPQAGADLIETQPVPEAKAVRLTILLREIWGAERMTLVSSSRIGWDLDDTKRSVPPFEEALSQLHFLYDPDRGAVPCFPQTKLNYHHLEAG